jgi:hypothetical protein
MARLPWMAPLLLVMACACGKGGDVDETDRSATDVDTDTDADSDTDADTDTDTDADKPLELCINEFMPDNQSSLADETGAHPDWIEIMNPGTVDVPLAGWSLTDNASSPQKAPIDPSFTIPAGGFMVFYADNLPGAGSLHLPFSLDSLGEEVGLFAPDGRGSDVIFGPIAQDLAFARVPDCCVGGETCWQYPFGGTPGASNTASGANTVILAEDATWKYWDQGGSPGAGWQTPNYDDSLWPSGPAPLGYGDGQATIIGFGADSANKYVTSYFRTTFLVADPAAITSMRLQVRRDDGVGIFINGISMFRNNLPGEVGPSVLAETAIEGADETTWLESTVWTNALVAGPNSIVAEVHQASVDSDDLNFQLQLLTNP